MATNNYTKRAQDSLDLLVIADLHLANITRTCKAAVAYSVSQRMGRFKQTKEALEQELKRLSRAGGGLFSRLKNYLAIQKLKTKILEVNRQIVEWIDITYRHVFSASVGGAA